MHRIRTLAFTLGAGAAIASLAACSGGSQVAPPSPPAGPVSLAQSRGGAGLDGILGTRRLLTTQAHPGAGWLSPDARHKALLFVADQGNQRVAIFRQGPTNPPPVGQITDAIGGPDGLFVDKNGKLYVCNFGTGTVTEYPRGHVKHSKTLTGAGSPKYVVVGTDGTVYVSNFNGSSNGQLLEYKGGSTTPTTTIVINQFPAGLALDSGNNLYVAYNDPSHGDLEVLKFAPGSTSGTNLGIHVTGGYAGGATIDKNGNLIVDNQANASVLVFPPGATTPSQTYTGFSLAYQVALNHLNNHLYISDPFGPSVGEITYPGGQGINNIGNSLSSAFGVATSPDGSF